MSDIVERLREMIHDERGDLPADSTYGRLIAEGADEITCLTEEVERMRQARVEAIEFRDLLLTHFTAEVERLRAAYEAAYTRGLEDGKALRVKQQILIHKQADEIEALSAEVERLKAVGLR